MARNLKHKLRPGTGRLWNVHLQPIEIAAALLGAQSMLWGGDERIREFWERAHDELRLRCPGAHAQLLQSGDIQPLDPPEVRRAQRALDAARKSIAPEAGDASLPEPYLPTSAADR